MNDHSLKRSVGLTQMVLYGVGSMLGAGIYGLIGKAAGISGNAVWLSFIAAFVAAFLTGLSYASLGSRYPRAGGSAFIAERAFRSPKAGFIIGLCIFSSALVAIPAMAQVFSRNLVEIMGWSAHAVPFVTEGFIACLAFIIFRGLQESMWLNIVCAIIEIGGLLFIIATGASHWGDVNYLEVPPGVSLTAAVMGSTALTFFAFTGFEDVLNIGEETHNPQRTVPLGLVIGMVIVTFIYLAVAITVVSVVPWHQLNLAASPLSEVIAVTAPYLPAGTFNVIALFSVTNTILVGYVTVSRLLYGMAHQKLLHPRLGHVHVTRRTPHIAILTLLIGFTPFAVFGTVAQLASASTLLLLSVFTLVNLSLAVLQARDGEAKGRFEVPRFVPICGALACIAIIVARVSVGEWTAPAIALGLVVVIGSAYEVLRRAR
jgi:amino acid transporter